MIKNKTLTVTLIPGDGIGPEVTDAAVKIIEATGVKIKWEKVPAGAAAVKKFKTVLPQITFDSIKKNKVALKGPIGTPVGKGFKSVNVTIRKTLNLYSNLRPVKSRKGIESRYKDIDLVIIRENTEDLYSGLEYQIAPGVVETLKVITEQASHKIAQFAFKYASKNNRRKITVLHKANIMKLSDGLFLDSVSKVAKNYPKIKHEEMIIDNACMQLVLNPNQFDILLTENLYGDIVSEICAGLIGGLGFAPGANIGDECALFEAAHGSAPDIAGKNIANPVAITLSGALMLKHLGYKRESRIIENAVDNVLEEGQVITRDMGGRSTTDEMTDAIVKEVKHIIKQ
jgi:isocitrate dehydrogenase (NAD+)